MDGVKRVLMIGAHPDDEDTSLLAQLGRGLGAETAYLSLTRGEGGQNLIGPELWEGLGVIRTGELEAARDLDGGRQYFTRAFDFGFSKRADETLEFWHEDELLSDVVWLIRTFRPHVILSVFTGTPRDGHGHHQAAGIVTRQAFEAAGDPTRFPEHLALGVEPWTPLKLYGGVWRRPEEATIRFETGAFDPLLGRSLLQLAMESRSAHRSQDMGSAQPLGPRTSGARLERDRTGMDPDGKGGTFAGVDTTLAGLAAGLGEPVAGRVRTRLEAYRAAVARARRGLGAEDPFGAVEPIREAAHELVRALDEAGPAAPGEFRSVLEGRLELATRALLSAAGVVLDVRAADDLVTPGEVVRVTGYAWNGGPLRLFAADVRLALPEGWRAAPLGVQGLEADGSLAPGALATWAWDVAVPADADLSRLYYLREAREGAWYAWPAQPRLWGLPRDPAPVQGIFAFSAGPGDQGVRVAREIPWSYVGVNPARGEFRRPVLVVPHVSVSVAPGRMAWPLEESGARTLTVALRAGSGGGVRGTLSLEVPDGWSATPARASFELEGSGMERSVTFQVRPPGGVAPGAYTFRAVATTEDGRTFNEGYALVDYEHVDRAALFAPAEARVAVFPVRIAEGRRVGYVMGTGDDGPEAIRQLGATVTLLGPEAVRAGDFSLYDVVVLGARAYESREDLRAANAQLLDFARGGGTVVVQYNQFDYPQGGYAPYPVAMSRPAHRVSEEDAPVTLLAPEAPVFTTPNRITAEDFTGWVQERGLYFLSEWDEAYTPLLEMSDQGEAPARGSLLVAQVGDGVYAYVALSFFRQWSATVPGAYRLWANLLSLDGKAWRAFVEGRR
jgi:LmbE family N-acetylglucosaminyl deacetylase